jgi:hypothetical protein
MTWERDRGFAQTIDQHRAFGSGWNAPWAENALRTYFEALKNQNQCKTEDASEGGPI